MVRVICTGDRNWGQRTGDQQLVRDRLVRIASEWPDAVVVHGSCRGLDLIAASIAQDIGLAVEEHRAEWTKFHKGAGPKRNQLMADLGASLCLAFHHDLESSKGTKDMVTRARKANIPVEVIG